MRKLFAPRTLFVFSIFALVVLSAACRSTTPTSTPVPPTSNVPTALPPAPTAPPLTAAPTDVPPTEAPTAVLPTDTSPAATSAAPTDTPAAGATATTQPSTGVATAIRPATKPASSTASGTGSGTGSGVVEVSGGTPSASVDVTPIKGLYISALRFDPTYPVKNTPIMFYATLVNTTGKDQNYPVCAEIFRPGENKSFGITNCDTVHMAPGTAEFFIGSWIASGIKQCIPVRARAVLHENDTDNVRLVFTTTQGNDLWVDFNMCP